RVESSSDEEDLGEDASKQGRRINAIDADDEITLVSVQDDVDEEMFDVGTLIGDEVFAKQEVVAKGVNLTVDEVTLAQALAALKSVKPKVKGVVIEEPSVPVSAASASTKISDAITTTATIPTQRKGIVITELGTPTITRSSQQPSQAKVQDKGWKHKDLKSKDFDSIKELFDKTFKRVDEDKNTIELQSLMEVIPDEEEVAIDVVPLATKPPTIVDWKIHKEGKKSYYQIVRADGKSQMYRVFSLMLKNFSSEDLEDLYKLVKARYGSTRPVEDIDLVLWNDLKIMFEPHVEDEIWKLQQSITAALIDVNAAQSKLVLLENFNENYSKCLRLLYKVNAAKGVNVASEEVSTAELVRTAYVIYMRYFVLLVERYDCVKLSTFKNKDLKEIKDCLENKIRGKENDPKIWDHKWYQIHALRNFDLEYMELESTNNGPTAKLPILKLGEYEIWAIRIKQYFQIQDYALMELIENSNMSRSYPDANLVAAIETRFGGNAATKKTQKTLLKQQYENFSAQVLPPVWNTHVVVWMNKPEIETMSINDLYNNFKIVEQKIKKIVGTSSGGQNLAFMTAPSSSSINDANTAYSQVSAASPSVNTVSPQVCTISISDNTVYAFMVENPNGFNVLHQDLDQNHEDDLEAMDLKWQLSLLSVRAKKYYQKTGKKIFINGNDIAGYDKSKVECYNYHKLGHFARECRASRSKEDQFRNQDNTKNQGNKEDTSKEMLAINGVGFDWSDMAEEQVQSNMALMAFSDSEVYTDKTCSKTCLNNYKTLKKQYDDLLAKQLQTKFESATYKRGLDTIEAQLVTYRKNEVLFSEEVVILKREVGIKQYEINTLKTEFEKLKQEKDAFDFKIEKFDKASKDLDQLLESQITDKSKKGLGYSAVPPPHPLIYNRPNKLDLSYSGLDEFKEPEFKGYGLENNKKKSNVVKESDNSKKF
ncbi:retrovirus-related pol polyprotein from transposon TNT 1-94, partial [Tanacetum coccineum]